MLKCNEILKGLFNSVVSPWQTEITITGFWSGKERCAYVLLTDCTDLMKTEES